MDLQTLVSDVADYTQQRLAHYVQELTALCAIDSGSYYKPGLDAMALYLANRLREMGMQTTIIENELWGNDMLATIRGTGRGNVLLLGHIDTVYPTGTAALRPVRLEGDVLYGPGVCDMKGCILSALYAVEALLAINYRDFGEIRFLCVSDEEIFERHCLDTIREACQDCQGALVLEAARANGDIVIARKGNAGYLLTAHGRAAHVGVEPEKGRNAIVELAHQIGQLQQLQGWRPGLTINPGLMSGGTAINVVPEYAQVQYDVRFLTLEDKYDTERRWRELLTRQVIADVTLTLEEKPDFQYPMVRTAQSLQLAQQAQHIAHLLGFSVEHVFTGGSSDASCTSRNGVPTLDGLGPIGGADHSSDEYLLASSVAPRTALLAGLIATIGASHEIA
jgi:glutamate carboxypeptidase